MTVELLGYENKSFTTKDGKLIEGKTIYYSEPINSERGLGERADSFFLSAAKYSALKIELKPGMKVEVYFNRFGKVDKIEEALF